MPNSVAQASWISQEMKKRLSKDGIVNLEDLSEKRIGEMWAKYATDPQRFRDWFYLLCEMKDSDLRFRDCHPSEVMHADMPRYRLDVPDRQSHLIYDEGPYCLDLYKFITKDDLVAGLPHFDKEDQAAVKKFLETHFPDAPVLKDL